jgi:hypothetical protein
VLPAVEPACLVKAVVVAILAGVPVGYLVHSLMQPRKARERHGVQRLRNLVRSFRYTFRDAVAAARSPGTVTLRETWSRLSDVFGVLLWAAVMTMGLSVFAAATLWGFLLELVKG